MNILFLSYDLPYPLDAGGKIRSYHLIKQLSKAYDVHLRYFYRSKETKDHEDKLSGIVKSIHGYPRRGTRSLSTVAHLPHYPFPAALYVDSQIKQAIGEDLAKYSFDAIHLESFYMSAYLSDVNSPVQILGTENIEWRVYQEFSKRKNRLIRSLMSMEVKRIRAYEKRTWNKADAILAVSNDNKHEIEQSTNKPVYLIKNGVDTERMRAKKDQSHIAQNLLFVGNFAYMQNQQAVQALLQEIAPALSSDFHIRLVGRNPTDSIVSMAREMPNITLDTQVEDIRTAYKSADMLVAPIMVGSGTKFKVLEAMAVGLPVITTPIGAEGIDAPKGALVVGQKPKNLVPLITKIAHDQVRRAKMAKKSRKLIESEYSWDAIGQTLRKTYGKIINNHS